MENICKIKKDFELINSQVSDLVEQKYTWCALRKYTEDKGMDKDDVFYEFLKFIAFNYRDLAIVNVCKQVDEYKNSISFINLLIEIKKNSASFTQEWFVCQYSSAFKQQAICNFNKFKGRSKCISQTKIEKDIEDLRKAVRGRKTKGEKNTLVSTKNSLFYFRNKRLAHHNKSKIYSKASVQSLYSAIDLMEKLVLKYDLLLNQSDCDRLLCENIDDFLQFNNIFSLK